MNDYSRAIVIQKNQLNIDTMFDPVITFVFIMGVFISSLFVFGLKLYRDEIKQQAQNKKESKLSYRTNEEFVGKD